MGKWHKDPNLYCPQIGTELALPQALQYIAEFSRNPELLRGQSDSDIALFMKSVEQALTHNSILPELKEQIVHLNHRIRDALNTVEDIEERL